jgi:hypothetical protein
MRAAIHRKVGETSFVTDRIHAGYFHWRQSREFVINRARALREMRAIPQIRAKAFKEQLKTAVS